MTLPKSNRSNRVPGTIAAARSALHRGLVGKRVLGLRKSVPSNADSSSVSSKKIAVAMSARICADLGVDLRVTPLTANTYGKLFADAVAEFVGACLKVLPSARGDWIVSTGGTIKSFAQYAHMQEIEDYMATNPSLEAVFGGNYVVEPDVVVARSVVSDVQLHGGPSPALRLGDRVAERTFIREANTPSYPFLQAAVSCKWTLRADRAQNSRLEALNLIRNRKGRAPAITVVTAEPLPSRLASLADGTGDIDCVYHVALRELAEAVAEVAPASQVADLRRMIDGHRLADISDLPFDIVS